MLKVIYIQANKKKRFIEICKVDFVILANKELIRNILIRN